MDETNKVPIIKIENLCKKYSKAGKFAVQDFSLECFEGEIVGLLGHNGAGKSTTLKCLTGIIPATSGKIEVLGFNIEKDAVQAKLNFGFVSDKHDVFVRMTGQEYLNFIADAYGVSEQARKKRYDELETVFRMGDRIFDMISDYSHGMRQKICMMGSLIHNPKLWILDEPMIGLDPLTSSRVQEFMKNYAKQGNCILFSSHNIASVQKLCSRAVIIANSKKIDEIDIADFTQKHTDSDLEKYFLQLTTMSTGGLGFGEARDALTDESDSSALDAADDCEIGE